LDKQRQLDDFFGLTSENEDKKSPHKKSLKEMLHNKNRGFRAKLRLLPKIFSKKERYIILVFLLIIVGSLISLPITSYYHFTIPVPSYGGTIKEGLIGEARHINPLLSQSDADRDLVNLIFSGLLQYNEKGQLIPDLALSYEVSPDELNYTFKLREGAKWHDDEPITADDVVFTIQAAQNPDYGSLQRINWQGVEVEKADEYTIILKLKNKYSQFLNNLTLPILPAHAWENVKPINFALSELNIKPIGSGPYNFNKLQKNESGKINLYELVSNRQFYGQRPFIDKVQFKFYESEDELINSYNQGDTENLGFVSSKNLAKVKFKNNLTIEEMTMPRYFGIFINQNQSKILSDKNIRLSLAHSTDKQSIIEKVLNGKGVPVDSPMLQGIYDINEDIKKYDFNLGTAEELLNKSEWNQKGEDGIRKNKNGDKLSLKITTSTWPELIEVTQILKEQWKQAGIDLQIETLPISGLQQTIRDRNYEMLLFGEILTLDPDPFSLWHSSQKRDPGLNLALYDNKSVDTLLEDARKTLNPTDRFSKYNEFQKLVIEDIPAIFLYSPQYLYAHNKKVRGFQNEIIATPSDHFSLIEKWYIETNRNFK